METEVPGKVNLGGSLRKDGRPTRQRAGEEGGHSRKEVNNQTICANALRQQGICCFNKPENNK